VIVAAVLVGLAVVPRLIQIARVGSPDFFEQEPHPFFFDRLALLDAAVVPRALLLLVPVGVAATLASRRMETIGATLWLLAVAVGFSVWVASFVNPPPSSWRLELPAVALFVVLAAGSVPLIARVIPRRAIGARGAGAVAFALLAPAPVVGLAARMHVVTATFDQQQEWNFLLGAIPRLPDKGALLTSTNHGLDEFPGFLLARSGKRYPLVDLRAAAAGAWPRAAPGLLYYEGMYCYFSLGPQARSDRMSEPCLEAHRRYALRPLLTTRIPGPGYSHATYNPAPFEIGFYEITGDAITPGVASPH
jgi:hypothetical protein